MFEIEIDIELERRRRRRRKSSTPAVICPTEKVYLALAL